MQWQKCPFCHQREAEECCLIWDESLSLFESCNLLGRKVLLRSIADKANVTQGPPLVNLVTHIMFWKKKEAAKPPATERIIPLPNLSSSSLDTSPTTSVESVDKAREALKVLRLERQIIGSAVTTIYESHSKGVINEAERDRMLEKYKADLKQLEKGIEENQQVVDLHDLEAEREEMVKKFNAKLAEIDARLETLKSGTPPQKPAGPRYVEQNRNNESRNSSSQVSDSDPVQPAASDSEKRIEKIREDILKAMDRLEQIETEG